MSGPPTTRRAGAPGRGRGGDKSTPLVQGKVGICFSKNLRLWSTRSEAKGLGGFQYYYQYININMNINIKIHIHIHSNININIRFMSYIFPI